MATTKFDSLQKYSYQNARDKIQTGDILFCSGEYSMSKLIRHFSNSRFSHVGFVFKWNRRVMLVESVEDDGVRAVPLSHYLYDYENSGRQYEGLLYIGRHKNIPSDETTINEMIGRAADLLNRAYDRDEIAKIALRVATGFGRSTPDDEYICSEFVEECFKTIGIVFQKDSAGFIFPEHIAADPNVDARFEVMP